MKTLHFKPIDAWTFIEPGAPGEVGPAAAARAVHIAEQAVSQKDRDRLEGEFIDLARYRDSFAAPDFAVLTTSRPDVRVIAHTSVHYFDGDGATRFMIDDAWDDRRSGRLADDPDVTERNTELGTATRIVLRHLAERVGIFRKPSIRTSVRWIQPFSDDLHDMTAILTSVILHESDVELALPHVDRLALQMEIRESP